MKTEPCGCIIFTDRAGGYFIEYCPMHDTASDLLFVAKQALMAIEEGYHAPKITDDLREIIAKAEKETNESETTD